MKNKKSKPELRNYLEFLNEIKARIRSAQYIALRAANKELVTLYWDMGRMIYERQKHYSWGRFVVEKLARDLQMEFPVKTCTIGARNKLIQNYRCK